MDDPFVDDGDRGDAAPPRVSLAFEPAGKGSAPAAGAAPSLEQVDLGGERRNVLPELDEPERKQGESAEIFEVTVSDPEKKGEGMYAYVTYKVNTKVAVGGGKFRQSSVVRRYSDFVWLRKRLVSHHDGFLVAPLPEKAILGRFSPMFVDSRRRGLELFLNRLARHAAHANSEDLRLFLHGGQDFADLRDGTKSEVDEEDKPTPSSAGASLWGTLSSIGAAVSESVQTVSSWGPGKEREKSKDDITCESIDAYADQLHASVSAAHKNVAALTKKTKDIANAWFDFGFSCTLLGQFETEQDEQHLGNAFAKLGNCADRLSVLITQKVDTQVVHFQEPFDDFLRQIDAVKEMLKGRTAALVRYQGALTALEGKQATLSKYQGRPGKEAKALAVEQEVVEAQRRVDEALQNLQTVTERVFAELARFRQEARVNFKNIMLDFVRLQIENSRKVQAAWESVLPDIQAMPFDQAAQAAPQ